MKRCENKFIPDQETVAAFMEIAETGSLTKAADRLNTSKSTLSRRIKAVEDQVGQLLLRREANRLSLTPAGVSFVEYCNELLLLADRQQKNFESLTHEVLGTLHVAIHNAFSRGWFSRVMDTFITQHPKLRLSLRTCRTPSQTHQMEEVILWIGEPIENGLKHEKLGRLTQGIYAAPSYVADFPLQHPTDITEYKWVDILGQNNGEIRLFHKLYGPITLTMGYSQILTDQLVMQADAIVRGNGIGLFPDWIAGLRLRAHPGCMVKCLEDWKGEDMPIWLMYPYGQLSQRTNEFIRHVKNQIPDEWL